MLDAIFNFFYDKTMLQNFFSLRRNTLPKYGQLFLFVASSIAFLQSIKDNRLLKDKNFYLEKISEVNKLKEQLEQLKEEKPKLMENQITEQDWNTLQAIDTKINLCIKKLHSNSQILTNNSNLSPEKVSEINAEATENISTIADNTENFSKIVRKYLDKFNPKDGTNNFLSGLDNLFNGKLFSGMSLIETGAIMHISGALFILFSLFTIISILFGNMIIERYNLEKRWPKLARLIQLRNKVTKYSLILNFSLIILVLLVFIFFNFYFFYFFLF